MGAFLTVQGDGDEGLAAAPRSSARWGLRSEPSPARLSRRLPRSRTWTGRLRPSYSGRGQSLGGLRPVHEQVGSAYEAEAPLGKVLQIDR